MEYSIVMIKPGFTSDNYIHMVKQSLVNEGLCVCREFTKKFTQNQIKKAFFSVNTEESVFVNYLSSEKMLVILVCGENSYEKTRRVKHEIRRKFNLTHRDLKNILHSTDDGVEFYLQYNICKELHDLELDKIGYANFFILNEYALNNKNFEKIAIVKETRKELIKVKHESDFYGFISIEKIHNEEIFTMVNYVKNKKVNENEKKLKFVIFNERLLSKDSLHQLNMRGVQGVLINNRNISIKDAELVYDYLENYCPKWIVIFGGAQISMGQKSYNKFLKLFYEEI